MDFKRLRYNSGEGRVKIKIEDDTGRLMENWTIMMSDLGKWVTLMHKKYGIVLEPEKKDRDLDWLK